VSVHLAKRFQRRRFFNIGQSEERIAYGAMFVDGSGQNGQSLERTFHRWFLTSFTAFDWGVSEEKIKMWKVNERRTTDDRRQTTDAKWWQKLTLPLARWANNSSLSTVKTIFWNELEMINEDNDTFQSDLYQFVEKLNKIFIDTSKETFRSKIFYKENTSK
jgi:hypothetical protein